MKKGEERLSAIRRSDTTNDAVCRHFIGGMDPDGARQLLVFALIYKVWYLYFARIPRAQVIERSS